MLLLNFLLIDIELGVVIVKFPFSHAVLEVTIGSIRRYWGSYFKVHRHELSSAKVKWPNILETGDCRPESPTWGSDLSFSSQNIKPRCLPSLPVPSYFQPANAALGLQDKEIDRHLLQKEERMGSRALKAVSHQAKLSHPFQPLA